MLSDLRKIFKEFDLNGDGQLSYDELKKGFRLYIKNEEIADKDFDNLISKIDLDKNNYINYEEFLMITCNLDNILTEKNLKYAFDFFDKDKSGSISPEEIKEILFINPDPNNPLKENEILNEIVKEIDTNGDGLISYEEFKCLMIKVLKGNLLNLPKDW